jgi:hypothetical protein
MENVGNAPLAFSDAEQSFQRVRSRLEGLDEAQVRRPNMDLSVASDKVWRVAQAVEAQGLAARFAKLPSDEWEVAHLHDLKDLSGACWYVQQRRLAGRPFESQAKVSVGLLREARALRAAMLEVGEYNLDGDPQALAELADIRRGSGYADLRHDLGRLAGLYQRHAESLSKDGRKYDAEDVNRALGLERRLRDELGVPPAGSWDDLAFRAWTAMSHSYGEVLAAAGWLFRAEPARLGLFPSLHTKG